MTAGQLVTCLRVNWWGALIGVALIAAGVVGAVVRLLWTVRVYISLGSSARQELSSSVLLSGRQVHQVSTRSRMSVEVRRDSPEPEDAPKDEVTLGRKVQEPALFGAL